jgi:hypothetical protein
VKSSHLKLTHWNSHNSEKSHARTIRSMQLEDTINEKEGGTKRRKYQDRRYNLETLQQ